MITTRFLSPNYLIVCYFYENVARTSICGLSSFFQNHFAESANHEYLLEQIEQQISKTKEEALSRKEILEKVEKWLAASQEESWLEEYNRVGHYCIHILNN